MNDAVKTPDAAKDTPAKEMSVAEAAKRVKRLVVETVTTKDREGNDVTKDVTKRVAVEASEVLAFRDYGSHVVVVTKDGKKLSSAADAE